MLKSDDVADGPSASSPISPPSDDYDDGDGDVASPPSTVPAAAADFPSGSKTIPNDATPSPHLKAIAASLFMAAASMFHLLLLHY